MNYSENKPQAKHAEHIESIWDLNSQHREGIFFVIPELVFDILIVRIPVLIKFEGNGQWEKLEDGVYFVGLFDKLFSIRFYNQCNIFGIRIKPFALSHLLHTTLKFCRNKISPISQVFGHQNDEIINNLLKVTSCYDSYKLATEFIESAIIKENSITDSLRQKTNYIMTQKGMIKNSTIYDEFETTKATLRNVFLTKMGILPKSFIKIMRANYALEQKYLNKNMNLTELAYATGYFDQSHFIKDFKSIFYCIPKEFFRNIDSTQTSMERIHRRFSSYYAPVV